MKIEIARNHQESVDVLKQRAAARLAEYVAKYPHLDLTNHCRWASERVVEGSYKGGTGRMTFTDTSVVISLDVPFFARPFRARIEAFIERELDAALPRA